MSNLANTQTTQGAETSVDLPETQARRSWLQRIRDWLWGYDFFISYHWASGGPYAVNLAQRLRDAKYDVFLDRAEYAMGDDWKKVGAHALSNTQRLILVATREAATESKPVEREVNLFTGKNRQVIPIVFGNELEGLDWSTYDVLSRMEESRLRVIENLENLEAGPSTETINQLIKTHGLMRRRTLRRWIISVLITLIGVSAVAVGIQWQVAVKEAQKANLQLAKTLIRQGIYERDEQGDLTKASHYFFQAAAAGAEARDPRISINARIAGNIAAKRLPTRWLGFEYRGRVQKVVFKEDKQWLLTLGEDEAWIWNLRTGDPLAGPMVHTGINGAQFSNDRTRLLTWGGKQVRIWESRTGNLLSGELMMLDSEIERAAFSKDEQLIFAWGKAAVQLWGSESGKPLAKLPMRNAAIKGAVLSRDNRRVLFWTAKGAQIWDSQQDKIVPDLTPAHSDKRDRKLRWDQISEKALFSPDENRVLTWTSRTARLLDSYTGETISPRLRSPSKSGLGVFEGALFSEDGKLIVTFQSGHWGEPDVAQVWDGVTGKQLSEPMEHLGIRRARFSKDQRYLLTLGSGSAQVREWKSHTGESVTGLLNQGGLLGAVFSQDQKRVLTWGGIPDLLGWAKPGTAHIWDSRSGKLLVGPMVHHEKGIRGAQLSADQSRLLTWGEGIGRIWDSHTGKLLSGPYSGDYAIFSTDENLLLTLGTGVAQVWDSRPLTSQPALMSPTKVRGTQLSPNGKRLLTWGGDRAQISDNSTLEPLSPPVVHDGLLGGANFSADQRRILTWENTAAVHSKGLGAYLWDSHTGELRDGPFLHPRIDGAQFGPQRQRLLTWGGGTARIWDSHRGEPLDDPIRHDGIAAITGAKFSGDHTRFATLSTTWYKKDSHLIPRAERDPGSVRVWDSLTGKPLTQVLQHAGIKGVRFSRDAHLLLTWGVNHAQIWKLRSDKQEACEIKQQGIKGAVFSRDEQRVLTWCSGGMHAVNAAAQVWNTRDCTPISAPMPHEKGVVGARFSDDQRSVLTWGVDGTARLWDSYTGDPLLAPMAHLSDLDAGSVLGGVKGAIFSPDGYRVLTWSGFSKDSIQLWDSHTGERLSLVPLEYAAPLFNQVEIADDEHMSLRFRSGYRSPLVGGRISDLIADLDFPHQHLMLRLEVKTGRTLNDIDDVEDLTPEQWNTRWAAYEALAREHLKECRFPRGNWYLQRMLHRPGSCDKPGDWLDQVNPATLEEVKEMYASVCVHSGRTHLKAGRYQEARRHFDTARIVQPNRASAYAGLARALIESGEDPAKGVEYAERSMELNPYQAPTYALSTLVEGYMAIGKNLKVAQTSLKMASAYILWQVYQPALDAYHQALDLQPNLKEQVELDMYQKALDPVLDDLSKKKDWRALATAYEQALKVEFSNLKVNAIWSNELANILIDKDMDLSQSIIYASRSLELDPKQSARLAVNTLAKAYVKQARYDEAIGILEDTLQKVSDHQDRNVLSATLRRAKAAKEAAAEDEAAIQDTQTAPKATQ